MAVQMKSILEDIDKIYTLIKNKDGLATHYFRDRPFDVKKCLTNKKHITSYLMWDSSNSYIQSVTGRKYHPYGYYAEDKTTRGYHFYEGLFTKLVNDLPRIDLSVWWK